MTRNVFFIDVSLNSRRWNRQSIDLWRIVRW